jgi:hypothetical protein
MNGAVPFLPLYAFMLCRGTALSLLLKAKLSPLTPWRHICGEEVEFHSFLAFAIHRGDWLTSNPRYFSPKKTSYPPNRRLCAPYGLLPLLGYKHQCHALVQSIYVGHFRSSAHCMFSL